MNIKKLSQTIGLLLIILISGVFIAKELFGKKAEIPQWVKDRPEERIDVATGELMTKNIGEWEKLGSNGIYYKNPTTGAFAMATPLICFSCEAKIAPPEIPAELMVSIDDIGERVKAMLEVNRIRRSFLCPKCGKPAYQPGAY